MARSPEVQKRIDDVTEAFRQLFTKPVGCVDPAVITKRLEEAYHNLGVDGKVRHIRGDEYVIDITPEQPIDMVEVILPMDLISVEELEEMLIPKD